MRHTGILRTWHPDRGFGFIAPRQGGKEIFVHISALPRDGTQPVMGESLSFELARNAEGKVQAILVQRLALDGAPALPRSRAAPSAPSAPGRDTESAALTHPAAASRRDADADADTWHAPLGHAPLGHERRPGFRARASVPSRPSASASGWWRGGIMALAVVVLAGYGHSQLRQRQLHVAASTPAEAVAESLGGAGASAAARTLVAQPATARALPCDGRLHCSQMTSCGEAQYFLANCPGVKMDGDGDGRPCEEQLCGH